MPKSSKAVKRNGVKMKSSVNNRKKAMRRALTRKTNCKVEETSIKEAWDKSKTPRENLTSMGLSFNPNDSVPIKETHRNIIDIMPIDGVVVPSTKVTLNFEKKHKKKANAKASMVLAKLEKDVKDLEEFNAKQERKTVIPDRDVELCIQLIERYGDDYKAMARDPKNMFQYTPKQIEKKIAIHKKSTFYQVLG